jgi:hypothetical protein
VTYAVAGYQSLKSRIGLDNNQAGTAAKSNYASIIRVTADNGQPRGNLDGAVQATITK